MTKRHGNRRCYQLGREFNLTCQDCGCKVIRVSTVQKYRKLIRKPQTTVQWKTGAGDNMCVAVATVEHIQQLNQGGTSRRDNLTLLCKKCNSDRARTRISKYPKRKCRTCGCRVRGKKRRCKNCSQQLHQQWLATQSRDTCIN